MDNNINPSTQFNNLYQMYVESTDVPDLELAIQTMRLFGEKICQETRDPKEIDQLFAKLDTLAVRRLFLLSNNDPSIMPIIGFQRLNCNCCFNSLLMMLLSCFPEMYDKIADHYKEQYPALIDARDAFHQGLIEKKSVDSSVSQSVREVFHALFGRTNPFTDQEIFSANSNSQEDTREAFECLIEKAQELGFSPKITTTMTETSYFHPFGNPREATPLELTQYRQLEVDNTLTSLQEESQINLNVPAFEGVSFEQLLRNFFVNEGSQEDDPATYILRNGQLQSFKRLVTTKKFQTPQELLININRFGRDGSKIKTPLDVPQLLTLPSCATISGLPSSYELDFVVVHLGELGGGHYYVLRKLPTLGWFEVNDANVRFVKNEEIAAILQGKQGHTLTGYMHHYTLKREGLFKVEYQGEGSISVSGGFNDWNVDKSLSLEEGVFYLNASDLKEGDSYEFKFLLDKQKWLKGENLKITVGPSKEVKIDTPWIEYRDATVVLKRDNFDA